LKLIYSLLNSLFLVDVKSVSSSLTENVRVSSILGMFELNWNVLGTLTTTRFYFLEYIPVVDLLICFFCIRS